MLQHVNVGHKSLADYASIQGREVMDEIAELREPLAGLKVLHLSATAFGGGVAEILYTIVPLMRDAGLDVDWRIISGRDEFFEATKRIHNALQGDPRSLTPEEIEVFRQESAENAEKLADEIDHYDVAIVHDPQPLLT